MQTVLGSGGAIGIELAKELTTFTDRIRLVSRNPQKVNPSNELMSADLTISSEVHKAVQGSSVVYVTVGFPYQAKVWERVWPRFITDVIVACKENQAKLVFFDNIYMYDKDHLSGMTEETPVNPPSRKGRVRARIARKMLEETESGELTALIARSADFYGPHISNTSVLAETAIKPLIKGGKANWMGSDRFRHSFTYTPDAARATALLGNAEDVWNQVWHLPTSRDPWTGREWVEAIAAEAGTEPRYRTISSGLMKAAGLLVPAARELAEMMYQYDRDYIFDSSKFERRFEYEPMPYESGLRETVAAYKRALK